MNQAVIGNFSNQTQVSEVFRVPPHAMDAEQSVLGGLMLEIKHFDDVSAVINLEDFYTKQHQAVFQAIRDLYHADRAVDLVTVIDYLENSKQLELAGGKEYLVTLVNNTPGASNILFYSQIVRDKSILRKLIETSNEIASECYVTQNQEVKDILDRAESKILAIAEHGQNKEREYRVINELMVAAMERIEEICKSNSTITGIETHYTDLDDITAGLQKGDMIIVAGRPSMGKTTFSMNLAENIAIDSKVPVAVFSLEMPAEQLAMRMLSSVGRIDANKMRTGKLMPEDWTSISNAIGRLSNSKIFIDDAGGLSITELRARARRLDKDIKEMQEKEAKEKGLVPDEKNSPGLGLIVIDYLQLMRGSTNTDNRVNEISEISRGLKGLAKELDIPVIALSQLNRSLEQRPDKRPKMSDLRESGAIEQDADLIMFIYRDEVYHPDSEQKGTAEIIIGKHRNGAIGTVNLAFIAQYTRFENLARHYDSEGFD